MYVRPLPEFPWVFLTVDDGEKSWTTNCHTCGASCMQTQGNMDRDNVADVFAAWLAFHGHKPEGMVQ